MLERTPTLGALLQDTDDRLIVTGLGSAANDVAYLTDFSPRAFTMDGVMGAAVSVGLGLALARPEREVIVVTGDGELLMNVGALATVAIKNPQNLRIVVLDNGLYGLTGGQQTAASTVTDLELMAKGAGIPRTMTVYAEGDIASARAIIAAPGDAAFILVKVGAGPSADVRIDRDGSRLRSRFRQYVLGEEAAR
jgi:phosphonopyruvate decarboxylase